MAMAYPARVSALMLCLLPFFFSFSSFSTATTVNIPANEHTLVVAESPVLQLTPGLVVEKSPGAKPGSKVVCERVQICGLSRLKNLGKFSSSVKVNVSCVGSVVRLPIVEVCFHRNISIKIGMCPPGQWEKLTKGSWARSMSPFDSKILDICVVGTSSQVLEVFLHEEFFSYRIIFLVLGIVMMTFAPSLSDSLVFYYGGAMSVGIVLVVLMVLFQGMRLLPTGRKNSLAIFLYSSIVGLGSFVLQYVPRLLRSILIEVGIGVDIYNPVVVFILLFLVLAGAWLGFWVVRKLVLTEDGSIDTSVAQFVAWSIRMFASVMILQSSMDPLLAAEALVCGILVSSSLQRIIWPRYLHHLYKKFRKMEKSNRRKSPTVYASPVEDPYGSRPYSRAPMTKAIRIPSTLTNSGTFFSTFHNTPERRNFSKDEWNKFTRDSTKSALEELVSSPEFGKWAVAHAERITLAPKKDATDQRRRWLFWL